MKPHKPPKGTDELEQDLNHAQDLLKVFHAGANESKGKSFKPILIMAHNIVLRVLKDCPAFLKIRAQCLLGAIDSSYHDFFGNDPF